MYYTPSLTTRFSQAWLHNAIASDHLPCMLFLKMRTQTQTSETVPRYKFYEADSKLSKQRKTPVSLMPAICTYLTLIVIAASMIV